MTAATAHVPTALIADAIPRCDLIDFDGIKSAALRSAKSLLPAILPGGKFRGLEYVVCNPNRNDTNPGSFSINYETGIWKDFATGDGGSDLVSLIAYLRNTSQGDAARELADMLDVSLTKSNGKSTGTHAPVAKIVPWGDDGPPRRSSEARRHFYRNADGIAVKVKLKTTTHWVSWYRVFKDGNPVGWQPKKPDRFSEVPYIGSLDAFDPQLVSDQLFWPEGEKDVDSLRAIGLPAFTFGGVGDGLPEDIAHYLKCRHLAILADNDKAGRDHAERKAMRAQAAGAASVRILHFDELQEKGDVSDWLAAGGTREKLLERSDAMELWAPLATESSAPSWRVKILLANDLQGMTFPPVRHILPGYISEGATIIAGKPKIGKSWLTLDLCLAATADRFTLGTLKPVQGDVLYLALEDNPRRLKSRLAKIWPSTEARWPQRLALATDWRRADDGGLADIEEWCRSATDPVLVCIDTLEKFRPIQNGKSAAYSADYAAVTGLQKIASKYRVGIVINHHVRKMEADDPFDTVSGTLGLTGATDTIIVLKRQSSAVTLYARGRDIEDIETAIEFDGSTCRWKMLGAASEVFASNARAAVLKALSTAGIDGLAVPEIMAATGRQSRGAVDTLLFKMKERGEILRLKRGIYALPKDCGKIGEKERNTTQVTDNETINRNLSDLTADVPPRPHALS